MVVKGATKAERDAARAQRTTRRRVAFYAKRIRESRNGREQLQHATDFAKAVGGALDDAGRRELARLITALADERNQP